MTLAQVIVALQTQLDALTALAASTPQFTQVDVDAAKEAGVAVGVAQGLAQAASVLGSDLAKLTADVAALSPKA